ncbi:ketoacyl-synthetase C-terminal extension domain-containing protein [Escherichia coli]|uniref:ketoacyl-synthetase C-terminal extension domain-containing protein n=1 Tax=Escherichia coli TaxID=562 RepID=UPI0020269FED|nr:ketoacyl-synthetase C-terminal extension domain-containing protein [Escherichia coli]
MSAQAWQDEMRYAGVSSFGIGGTNCHMIVASLPDALNARLPNTDSGRKSTALLLSAASDSALRRLATDYAGALRENADASSLAFTALHARRLDLPFRLAAPLNRETAEALSAWAGEKSGALVYSGRRQRQAGVAVYRPGLALAHYGSNDVPSLNGVCRHAGSLFFRL